MAVSIDVVTRVGPGGRPRPAYAPGAFDDKEPAFTPPRSTAFDITRQPPRLDDAEFERYLYNNFDTIRYLLENGFTGTFDAADGKQVVVIQGLVVAVL